MREFPASLGLMLAGLLLGCGRVERPDSLSEPSAQTATAASLGYLSAHVVGAPTGDRPWIAHVAIADLDRDGRPDILVCDAKANAVIWLRQTASQEFEEIVLAAGLPAPVHIETVDIDGDGDLDLLVACMGQVFPTNEKVGSLVILENNGGQSFTKRVILDRVARVTDVRAGDFNGDGRLDLAVAQFGYDEGEIRWLENLGDWQFKSHNLLNLSGAINVCVADMDGDGTLDITAVVSQQWEEIYLFRNDGRGNFASKVIFGSTNEDFGSSGISLSDLNRDGRLDVLYTNGDGFDYAQPGSRSWHGVQWLENLGGGNFRYHRVGDLPGAYSPVGVDLDGDGAIDIVACSGFNDWSKPQAVSLMWFRNDGRQNFTPHVLAHKPTHLTTLATADLDRSGQLALISGGFHAYPPWDRMSRVLVWRRSSASPLADGSQP